MMMRNPVTAGTSHLPDVIPLSRIDSDPRLSEVLYYRCSYKHALSFALCRRYLSCDAESRSKGGRTREQTKCHQPPRRGDKVSDVCTSESGR
ncbi:uncharacterized protein O3Q21_011611 isoform 4-T13 [Podargus strigoides]